MQEKLCVGYVEHICGKWGTVTGKEKYLEGFRKNYV